MWGLEELLGFGFAKSVSASVGGVRAFAVLGDPHGGNGAAEFLSDSAFLLFGFIATWNAHATAAGFDGDDPRESQERLSPTWGVIGEWVFHR